MRPMRFGKPCSGMDGAAVTWDQSYCAEIDPFCCRLLTRHYPNATNYGDIRAKRDWPEVGVIVFGTPCQSFGINVNREVACRPALSPQHLA